MSDPLDDRTEASARRVDPADDRTQVSARRADPVDDRTERGSRRAYPPDDRTEVSARRVDPVDDRTVARPRRGAASVPDAEPRVEDVADDATAVSARRLLDDVTAPRASRPAAPAAAGAPDALFPAREGRLPHVDPPIYRPRPPEAVFAERAPAPVRSAQRPVDGASVISARRRAARRRLGALTAAAVGLAAAAVLVAVSLLVFR